MARAGGRLKWEKSTWDFTATDRTTLEICAAMPDGANPFDGPLIDDVKVVEAN